MRPKPRRQIVVTVNGPGEISGWLYPLATTLKRRAPDVRICVALLPCPFASGTEPIVLENADSVDTVTRASETTTFILRNKRPPAMHPSRSGCLLHLGGEPLLSLLLAKRLQCPALAYAEEPFTLQRFFDATFVKTEGPYSHMMRGNNTKVVGDLMVDAARLRCPDRRGNRGSTLTIGLFPGSRQYQIKTMLPFLIKAAGIASRTLPRIRWLVAKADFVSLDAVQRIATTENGRLLDGESATFERKAVIPTLVSETGLRFEIHPPQTVMTHADIALTLPGTNTAELGSLGIPMIVIMPTQHPEATPIPGLLGQVENLPLIGRRVSNGLKHIYLRRHGYLAHPNRLARRMVVPEIIGRVSAQQIAQRLTDMLSAPTDRITEELIKTMGHPGASERLTDHVLIHLGLNEESTCASTRT